MNRQERRKAEKEWAQNNKELAWKKQVNDDFNAAKELHQQGRLADAEAAYKALLKKVPGQPDVLFALAMMAGQIEQWGEAEHYLRSSLASNPKQPHVLQELGALLHKMKRFPAAEECFKDGLKLKSDSGTLWYNLGASQMQQGKLDDAIMSFGEAINRDGKFAMGLYYIGRCHAAKGEHEIAIGKFRESLELMPEAYPPQLDIATSLGKLDRWDEALEAAQTVNDNHPGIAEAMYVLGWAQEGAGQTEDAAETFRDILDREPQHQQAQIGLARLTGEDPTGGNAS